MSAKFTTLFVILVLGFALAACTTSTKAISPQPPVTQIVPIPIPLPPTPVPTPVEMKTLSAINPGETFTISPGDTFIVSVKDVGDYRFHYHPLVGLNAPLGKFCETWPGENAQLYLCDHTLLFGSSFEQASANNGEPLTFVADIHPISLIRSVPILPQPGVGLAAGQSWTPGLEIVVTNNTTGNLMIYPNTVWALVVNFTGWPENGTSFELVADGNQVFIDVSGEHPKVTIPIGTEENTVSASTNFLYGWCLATNEDNSDDGQGCYHFAAAAFAGLLGYEYEDYVFSIQPQTGMSEAEFAKFSILTDLYPPIVVGKK